MQGVEEVATQHLGLAGGMKVDKVAGSAGCRWPCQVHHENRGSGPDELAQGAPEHEGVR